MTSLSNTAIMEAVLSESVLEKTKNIFRAPHDRENPYTLITNKLLRDTTIKHSDRGLMCQLLSWSDYHKLCIQAIVKKSIEGRDAIRGMLDRLIQAGYIRMIQNKSQNGQFDTMTYQIFEQSTGVVVADLDLSGIAEDGLAEPSPQLDLFAFESEEMNQKNENVNQAANGKAESGKPETNNNYDLRNTIFSSNTAENENSGNQEKNTLGDLLRKWHISIDDPMFKAKIAMAGLSTFIINQDQLDRFLIDFNQQHDKYKNISESKRLHNFAVYLIRVKNTKAEYAKHVARLRALGLDISMPQNNQKSERKTQVQQRIQKQQTGCNPFEVVDHGPVEVSQDFLDKLEGF